MRDARERENNKFIGEKVQRQWTMMGMVKPKILKRFGHVCRMVDPRLIKTVILRVVEGSRPRARPAKRQTGAVTLKRFS